MALGASPAGMMGLILEARHDARQCRRGSGLLGALSISKSIAALLYGSAQDMTSFVGASLAPLLVVALAQSLPCPPRQPRRSDYRAPRISASRDDYVVPAWKIVRIPSHVFLRLTFRVVNCQRMKHALMH